MNYVCVFRDTRNEDLNCRWVTYNGPKHLFNEQWLNNNDRMYEFEEYVGVANKMPKTGQIDFSDKKIKITSVIK